MLASAFCFASNEKQQISATNENESAVAAAAAAGCDSLKTKLK
jgi:hypothetical protein